MSLSGIGIPMNGFVRNTQKASSESKNIVNSINLYYGDVMFPLPLISLEGDAGLQVSIALNYTGRCRNSVQQLAEEAADSILGMGWTFPCAQITVRNRSVKNDYQADYYLLGEGGEFPLYRTGKENNYIVFVSVEHTNYECRFYPDSAISKWEILREDGSVWTYGGSADSIATGLDWDGWVGPSTQAGGVPFPISWYLTDVRNTNNKHISFCYENVTEKLGNSQFTRAVRLLEVRSMFGHRAVFSYLQKEDFECATPHLGKNGMFAHQFDYDDVYLDHIDVFAPNGSPIYTQQLQYRFIAPYGIQKRVLSDITQIAPTGVVIQPLHLEYDETPGDSAGLLLTLQYPSGAKINWQYQNCLLPDAKTSVRVMPPSVGWQAAIYPSGDFTAVSWQNGSLFRLSIYQWNGGWHCIELDYFNTLHIENPRVSCSGSLVCVKYYDLRQKGWRCCLFRRNFARQFAWSAQELFPEPEPEEPAVCIGADFAVFHLRRRPMLTVYQFDLLENAWEKYEFQSDPLDFQALGAGDGFFFCCTYHASGKQLCVSSYYADESHQWRAGDRQILSGAIETRYVTPDMVWSIGARNACATFFSFQPDNTVKSVLLLLTWRAGFHFLSLHLATVRQDSTSKNPANYAVASDTIIGLAEHLFRWTPTGWQQTTLLHPQKEAEYRYAYGNDLALAVEYNNRTQHFYAIGFDPFSSTWTKAGMPAADPIQGGISQPVIFADYAILGRGLFRKAADESWELKDNLPAELDLSQLCCAMDGTYLVAESASDTAFFSIKGHTLKRETVFSGCRMIPGMVYGPVCVYQGRDLQKTSYVELMMPVQGGIPPQASTTCVSQVSLHTLNGVEAFEISYDTNGAALRNGQPGFAAVTISLPDGWGKSIFHFQTGLQCDQNAQEQAPYSRLAGRCHLMQEYEGDGTLSVEVATELQAVDAYGLCICERKQTKRTYLSVYGEEKKHRAIEESVEYEYEPRFHLRRYSRMRNYNGGQRRCIEQRLTYGWEVYPEMLAAHMLQQVVQTQTIDNDTGEVLAAEAHQMEQCPNGCICVNSSYTWNGTGDSTFNFAAPTADWRCETRVLSRTVDSSPIYRINEETPQSFLLDRTDSYPIATFSYAGPDEVLYSGFETYEKPLWEGVTADMIDPTLCFSGSQCLHLTSGQTVQAAVHPIVSKYLISFAFLIQGDGAGIRLSASGNEIFVPAPDTHGIWQQNRQLVEIILPADTCVIQIEAGGAQTACFDTVFLTPIDCEAQVDVFSQDGVYKVATHSNRTAGLLMEYDNRRNVSVIADDQGGWQTYHCRSLAGSAQPYQLDVQFAQAGKLLPFYRGVLPDTSWNPSSDWTIREKALRCSGTATLSHQLESFSFALYLKLSDAQSIQFNFGKVTVRYAQQQWSWALYSELSPLLQTGDQQPTAQEAVDMLLLKVGTRMAVFQDGDRVLTAEEIPPEAERVTVIATQSAITALAFASNPSVSLTYTDEVERALQELHLTEDGAIVSQCLYSPLMQAAVQTEQIHIRGAGFAYRQGFITNFDENTGIMRGEASTFLPQREGYPYSRVITTKSPSPQPILSGQPGKQYAIRPSAVGTVSMRRFANPDNSSVPSLQNIPCLIDRMVTPDGVTTLRVSDTAGQLLSMVKLSANSPATQIVAQQYNKQGQVTAITTPNYYDKKEPIFREHFSYDPRGNLQTGITTDADAIEMIHNIHGRLRFLQDAENRQKGEYVYFTYDAQGRMTESGTVRGDWLPEELHTAAEDDQYKPDGAQWKVHNGYDGTQVTSLGRLVCSRTRQESGAVVEETYAYDRMGNLQRKTLQIGETRLEASFTYNQSEIMTGIQCVGHLLSYGYDLQHRLQEIRCDQEVIYRCGYQVDGRLAWERLYPEQGEPIFRSYTYDGAGQLCRIQDPFYQEDLSYEPTASGRIANISSALSGALPSGFMRLQRLSCKYDAFGRLCQIRQTDQAQNEQCWQWLFDSNGNRVSEEGQALRLQGNRLSDGIQWDARGEARQVDTIKLCWDPVLSGVVSAGEQQYYLGADRLVYGREDQTGLTAYLYDSKGRLLLQMEPDGRCTILLYGSCGLIGYLRDGARYFLLKDHQATIHGLVRGHTLLAGYQYHPFGRCSSSFEAEQIAGLPAIRFTGQLLEPCGLYRMAYRWYDPVRGIFLSVDPEAQYDSPYLYGGSDWINYFDPDGQNAWQSFFAILGGIAMICVGICAAAAGAGIVSAVASYGMITLATALTGAGAASIWYGATSWIQGSFNVSDYWINLGTGALFFSAGAVASSLLPVTSVVAADIGVGVVIGALDGLVSNGLLNVSHGQSFSDHWLGNMLIGGLIGGISAGATGMSSGYRNHRRLIQYHNNGSVLPRNNIIGVGFKKPSSCSFGHSSIVKGGGQSGTLRGRHLQNDNGYVYIDQQRIPAGNFQGVKIKVNWQTANNLQLNDTLGLRGDRYSLLGNNCTTYVSQKLNRAGFYVPPCIREPHTLYLWAKCLGTF